MEGQSQSISDHHQNEGMTIIPARAMQLIERTLSDDDAEVRLCARANDVMLRVPSATIYSRLVEGRYPNPNQPISEEERESEIERERERERERVSSRERERERVTKSQREMMMMYSLTHMVTHQVYVNS